MESLPHGPQPGHSKPTQGHTLHRRQQSPMALPLCVTPGCTLQRKSNTPSYRHWLEPTAPAGSQR